MRARRRVAHQREVHVRPALAQHAWKIDPGRSADVVGVGYQLVTAEMFFENTLADRDRFLLRHGPEAEFFPGGLAAFDDEGRGIRIELVGVRPDPAMLGLLEDEGEGVVEFLVRAEPHELAFARIDVGLEHIGESRAGPRIQAVGGDDQIVRFHIGSRVRRFGLEDELDAEFPSAPLQQHEQPLAADAAEAVTGRNRAHALVHDRDVVPVGEMALDPGGADGIVALEIVQRFGRKHDAPAERVVGAVALDDRHLVRGAAQFHRDCEIEAGRPAAENRNLHRAISSRFAARTIAPERNYFKLKISWPAGSAVKSDVPLFYPAFSQSASISGSGIAAIRSRV